MDKIGLVCSHRGAARQLEEQLDALAGVASPSVVNSGVDYTAGRALRARGAGKGRISKFRERMALNRRRTRWLCKRKGTLGRKALRVITSGPMASGSYGAE
eukprot:8458708-Pyramimonas_sp.AAC.1